MFNALLVASLLALTPVGSPPTCAPAINGSTFLDAHGTTWGCKAYTDAAGTAHGDWLLLKQSNATQAGAQTFYDPKVFNDAVTFNGRVNIANPTIILDGGVTLNSLTFYSQTAYSLADGGWGTITADGVDAGFHNVTAYNLTATNAVVNGALGSSAVQATDGIFNAQTAGLAFYASGGGTLACSGASTATLQALSPSVPQVGFDTTRHIWVENTGDGGQQGIATQTNGLAGGNMSAYFNSADWSAAHGNEVIQALILQHPIPDQTAGYIDGFVSKAGTTGGTFAVTFTNASSGQILCAKTGISCTSGVSAYGAACVMDAGLVGDEVDLAVDATGCTGTDPSVNVSVHW